MNTTPDPAASPLGVDGTPNGIPQDGVPELAWEPATAYAIEGYDPDDPWNAVLCVEGRTTEVVLDLTPTHLDRLVAGLVEVRDAQRVALGVELDSDVDETEPDDGQTEEEKRRTLGRVTQAARLATGSAPVSRLWNSGTRGRMIIIGGAGLFVLLGVILKVII
ncbi:hypothetical protein [Flindersiella endophytica]